MGSHLFDRLFTYLGKNTMKKEMETDYLEPELYQLKVDARSAGKVMSENWKTSINGGYAKGLLNEWVQKAVRRVQEDIGFRYIRCKGIFDDELQLCSRDPNGKLVFNYVFFDAVMDFICACRACPWIELSYMPLVLCRKKKKERAVADCHAG